MPSLHTNRGAKRAREARAALGIDPDAPLTDLLQLIEERGGAHVLVLELPDGVAGAYLSRPGMPMLVVGGGDPVTRQRFTLAHEFGHFRMGHETVVDRSETMGPGSRDPQEVQANAFASEFLVPRGAVRVWAAARSRRDRVTLEDVVTLACRYGVSATAMRIRIATAGCLPDERQCRRLDSEIGHGLHTELADQLGLVPHGDSLTAAAAHLPRLPGVLRDSQLGDLLAGRTDVEGVARRLGRSVADVRASLATMGIDQLLPSSR